MIGDFPALIGKTVKTYVIYKWKNKLNGKCYIGLTSDALARKRHHMQGYNPRSWIYQAIKKHGIDAFEYKELESGLSIDEALAKEREHIAENGSFVSGYNQTPGGYYITGPKFGEKHHNSVLSEETALAIIHDPCSEIKATKKYNVHRSTVYQVRQGITWPHLNRSEAPVYESDKRKITEEDAKAIFLDSRNQSIIAKDYDIDQSAVSNIKRRKSWKKATKGLIKPSKGLIESKSSNGFFVYRLLNTVNNKVLIGISKEPKKRMSQILSGHGSRLIREEIKNHGRHIFIRQIISEFETQEEAYRLMQTLIMRQNSLYPSGYNMTIGGIGSHGHLWNMKQRDSVRGSKNGRSKLTETDVVAIFWDSRSRAVIAKEYGISTTLVTKIKRGQSWKHITQDLLNSTG